MAQPVFQLLGFRQPFTYSSWPRSTAIYRTNSEVVYLQWRWSSADSQRKFYRGLPKKPAFFHWWGRSNLLAAPELPRMGITSLTWPLAIRKEPKTWPTRSTGTLYTVTLIRLIPMYSGCKRKNLVTMFCANVSVCCSVGWRMENVPCRKTSVTKLAPLVRSRF